MSWASIMPIAERGIAGRGIAGRGVLIDMAGFRGKEWLDKVETFNHEDLEAATKSHGVTLEQRDILLVRTGRLNYWYSVPNEEFYKDLCEPSRA
jgi:hypothetical protein